MSTAPRHRDMPITVCGGNALKYGSPYSTVPLTRPEQDDDEPIYESVMDEIRCKINQASCFIFILEEGRGVPGSNYIFMYWEKN